MKTLRMNYRTVAIAFHFLRFLILVDLKRIPLNYVRRMRHLPFGLSPTRCLDAVDRHEINVLRLTIPLIAGGTSKIAPLDRAWAFVRQRPKRRGGKKIDMLPHLGDFETHENEWLRVLQLFAKGAIKERDLR